MKTYSSKSNARRAAKAAGFTVEGQDYNIVEAHTEEGSGFRFVPLNPTPADEPVTVVEATPHIEHPIPAAPVIEEAATPVVKKEVLHASTIESPTRKVWAIADELRAANPDVRRKDIMAACEAAGIAFFTARTQIQKWMKAKKEGAAE